jgi:hypothetical protein
VDIAASPHFPAAVKHVVAAWRLVGSVWGDRLRALCVKQGWPLLWALVSERFSSRCALDMYSQATMYSICHKILYYINIYIYDISYRARLVVQGANDADLGNSSLPVVSERFPLTPLQNCLFTPELQWQSRGQRRILQGWVQTGHHACLWARPCHRTVCWIAASARRRPWRSARTSQLDASAVATRHLLLELLLPSVPQTPSTLATHP